MATASFLGLPTEVRILIYKSIFRGREVALIDELVKVRHSDCQILQVCKKINQEAEPILHRTTLYIFGSPESITRMANRLPLAFFYHLRHVKLDIWLPSHGHIDYRGFCYLSLSQWGTALRLLYRRRDRTLKRLIVVLRGPTYANDVPPLQRRCIDPWRFEYVGVRDAIVNSIRAEQVEITDDFRRMDMISRARSYQFFARVWHV